MLPAFDARPSDASLKPELDTERIVACTAGLSSATWADPVEVLLRPTWITSVLRRARRRMRSEPP